MNLFAMMETSGSAMQAERMRAEVVAANMANAETTRTATGGPYRRQHVVFAANPGDPEFLDSLNAAAGSTALGSAAPGTLAMAPLLPLNMNGTMIGAMNGNGPVAPGVHIAAGGRGPAPPLKRYDPGHPDAGAGRVCLLSGH